MTTPPDRRRSGGRSARVRASVLSATLDELHEHGIEDVNISRVARRANVHESSIYRRWRSREILVLDALATHSEQTIPIPDTGTLRGDLIGLATGLAAHLSTPLGSGLLRVMAAAGDDPAAGDARTAHFRARYERAEPIVTRAVERGELPAGTDARLLLELLIAPLHFRTLMTREPLDDPALPAVLTDAILSGLSSADSRRASVLPGDHTGTGNPR